MSFLRSNPIKEFLNPYSDPNIELNITETLSFQMNSDGKTEKLELKGKISAKSSKKLSNLELFLSNAHKISNIKKVTAKEVNFSTSRTIVFDSSPKQEEIVKYEVDPSFINPPINISARYTLDDESYTVFLNVENCLKYSKIMENAIKDVTIEIQSPIAVRSMEIEPTNEKENITLNTEKDFVIWQIGHLEWKERRKLSLNIKGEALRGKLENQGRVIKVSFVVPNRTLSYIFIEKVLASRRFVKKELPFRFKYNSFAENCTINVASVPAKIVDGKKIIELIKDVERKSVLCGEEVKIIVRLRNCSNERLRDISVFDEIPIGFEIVKGENYWRGYLNPNEARELVYYVKSKVPGEYLLPSATLFFKDNQGRRHEMKSLNPKLIVKLQEDTQNFMICKYCGTVLPKQARFCGKCGRKVI